jgi:hypothetical protein
MQSSVGPTYIHAHTCTDLQIDCLRTKVLLTENPALPLECLYRQARLMTNRDQARSEEAVRLSVTVSIFPYTMLYNFLSPRNYNDYYL